MTDSTLEKLTGAESVVWDLSVFYDGLDDPRIEEDMGRLAQMVDDFAARYRGRVGQLTAAQMVEAHHEMEAIYDLRGRISSFASLNYSTNTNDPRLGAFLQKVMENGSELSQKMVFFDLEWNELDDAAAQAVLDDPALGQYRYVLEAERRFKPYQLSEPEEQILIEKDVTGASAWTRLFTQIMGASTYELDGQKLTQPIILSKLQDADRGLRQRAADALTAGLREDTMELTFIFNVLAADKAANDKRRGFPTWVSARNLSNKAPDAVVEALIETVTGSYDVVARHYRLKRTLLGYDTLYDYDRYAPLVVDEAGERFYTWDQAREIILQAFAAFSPEMAEVAARFFDGNWIHAPVTPGKRGGAFASPTVPSANPFVLVNYTGTANDVMTLAHELGHGIHMYLSGKKSGLYALYTPLTTAEMASVFGEMLVFQDMMAREPSPAVRLSMLMKKIEDTFATVFRQIAMNRFEHGMHTARRTEGELSTERLSEIWIETQRAMFEDSVTLRDEYTIWWSYVPHFLHTPGYVYAYAFGELLVLALYNLYRERGADFVPQYLDLLAAGDSDWPDKLLAKVGVDLNDPGFWGLGVAAVRELVQQAEALAREVYPERF